MLFRSVRFLIRHHLRSNQYSQAWTDSAVRRFHREMAAHMTDLLDLSRADITSNTYYDWLIDRIFMMFYASALVKRFLDTFKEFPPRQEPASFTINDAVEELERFLGSTAG